MKWDDAAPIMEHMPEAQVMSLQTVYQGHWIDIQRMGGGKCRMSIAKGPGTQYVSTDHDNINEIMLYLGFEHNPMMSVAAMDWHLYMDGRALDFPAYHFNSTGSPVY